MRSRPVEALLFPFRWLLYAARSAYNLFKQRSLKEGTWLELELEGPLRDRSHQRKLPLFLRAFVDREDEPEVLLPPVLRRLEVFETSKARGLVVTIKSVEGDPNDAVLLSARLRSLREKGKRVVARLGPSASNLEYIVASAADRILVTPHAHIGIHGHQSEGLYFADALAMLGLRFEVTARGKFKSAPESLTKNERSDNDRLQIQRLIDLLDARFLELLRERRNLDETKARTVVARAPHLAEEAVAAGLIDEVARDEELAAKLGEADPPRLIPFHSIDPKPESRPILGRRKLAVGIVPVSGIIVDEAPSGLDSLDPIAVSGTVVASLREALEDSRIGAVVLWIDSRGGSVTASDAIYSAVARLNAEKPVIACMKSVAASGGYYVALGARAIVASPLTLTGSIGVYSMSIVLGGLGERLKIHRDLLSNFPVHHDVWGGRSPEGAARDQEHVDAMYEQFVALVAKHRNLDLDVAKERAEGRVYLGTDAKEMGLVDGLGGLAEAVERAQKATEARFVRQPIWLSGDSKPDRPSPLTTAARLWMQDPRARELLMLAGLLRGRAVAWAPVRPVW